MPAPAAMRWPRSKRPRRENGATASAGCSGPAPSRYPTPSRSACSPISRPCAPRTRARRSPTYPGSPCLALRLMRADDRLIANELHEDDRKHLEAAIGRDARAKVMGLDGWVALKSLLPPKERRGVILDRSAVRGAARAGAAHARPGGRARALRHRHVHLLWYPIKDPAPVARFHKAVAAMALPKPPLCAELLIRRADDADDPQRLRAADRQRPLHSEGRFGRAAARAQPSPCTRSRRVVPLGQPRRVGRARAKTERGDGSGVCVSRAEKQARNCLAAMSGNH